MNAIEATQLVALMQATYPKLEVPQTTVKAYQLLFADLDAGDCQAAVFDVLRSRVYPTLPTPGEIRERMARRRFEEVGLPNAEAAWGIVMWAFRKVGYYRGFPDATAGGTFLKAIVERIGWQQLCQSDNLVADRAHFLRIYGAAYEAEIARLIQNPAGPLIASATTARPALMAPAFEPTPTTVDPE